MFVSFWGILCGRSRKPDRPVFDIRDEWISLMTGW